MLKYYRYNLETFVQKEYTNKAAVVIGNFIDTLKRSKRIQTELLTSS